MIFNVDDFEDILAVFWFLQVSPCLLKIFYPGILDRCTDAEEYHLDCLCSLTSIFSNLKWIVVREEHLEKLIF